MKWSDIKDFNQPLVGSWWTAVRGVFSVPASFFDPYWSTTPPTKKR
jgi:hypothetical protein